MKEREGDVDELALYVNCHISKPQPLSRFLDSVTKIYFFDIFRKGYKFGSVLFQGGSRIFLMVTDWWVKQILKANINKKPSSQGHEADLVCSVSYPVNPVMSVIHSGSLTHLSSEFRIERPWCIQSRALHARPALADPFTQQKFTLQKYIHWIFKKVQFKGFSIFLIQTSAHTIRGGLVWSILSN